MCELSELRNYDSKGGKKGKGKHKKGKGKDTGGDYPKSSGFTQVTQASEAWLPLANKVELQPLPLSLLWGFLMCIYLFPVVWGVELKRQLCCDNLVAWGVQAFEHVVCTEQNLGEASQPDSEPWRWSVNLYIGIESKVRLDFSDCVVLLGSR